ncbi:virulence-associated E family protein [Nostoc sp.]|uniref:virulence-associated E family protein n=1 Tax=Nostoc sp. TaxID=1180 RepID=UPI002FF3FFDE
MSYTDDNTLSSTQSSDLDLEGLLSQLRGVDIFATNVSGSAHFDNKEYRDQTKVIYEAKLAINKAGSNAGYVWFEIFKAVYAGRVKSNSWTGELLLDDKLATEEVLIDKLEQSLKMLMKLTREQFDRKFKVWIEGCSFNPVRVELESIVKTQTNKWIFPGTDPSTLDKTAQYTDRRNRPVFNNTESLEKLCSTGGYLVTELKPMPEWDQLASILFGTNDALSQKFIEKWLVSAVVRAMQPGCQVDYTLVLKGKQGAGKSTFFRILGGEYFVDLESSTASLEVQRLMDRSWVVEMGEIEGITRKKEVEEIKAFLTKTNDTFRGLYEKKASVHKRHVVFGGTCNSDEILKDNTGSRRFWIIDLGNNNVNRDFLVENRDAILATAYLKWQQGFTWYPDADMSEQSEDRNKGYQEANEWDEKVKHSLAQLQSYVDHKNDSGKSRDGHVFIDGLALNLSAFMETSLSLPVTTHRSCNKKVAQSLSELGYAKKRPNAADGSRPWLYIKEGVKNPLTVDSAQLAQLADCWKK